MNHKRSRYLFYIGAFLFLVFDILFAFLRMPWMLIVAFAILISAALQLVVFCRCPECGRFLSRPWWSHCPHCGSSVMR